MSRIFLLTDQSPSFSSEPKLEASHYRARPDAAQRWLASDARLMFVNQYGSGLMTDEMAPCFQDVAVEGQ